MIYELEYKEIKTIVGNEKMFVSTVLDGLHVLLTNKDYEEYNKQYIYQLQIAYVYLLKETNEIQKCRQYLIEFISYKLKEEYLIEPTKIINIISRYSLGKILYTFMENEMLKKIVNNNNNN